MSDETNVILVNFQDQQIGVMEKMRAHQESRLHRAFSVFLYRGDQILLQKRAKSKYHCGSLWTNTCCSHPAPGENLQEAAINRLKVETGISISKLQELFSFIYFCHLDHGLTEYECDHVFVMEYTGPYQCNPEEVECMKWVPIHELERDMLEYPHRFTPWFLACAPRVLQWIRASENLAEDNDAERVQKREACYPGLDV